MVMASFRRDVERRGAGSTCLIPSSSRPVHPCRHLVRRAARTPARPRGPADVRRFNSASGPNPIEVQDMTTSPGSKVLLLMVVALAVAVPPARAAKPPLCTAGRFAVDGPPLLGPGGEVVVLEDQTIAIGTLCAAQPAKLR